MAWVILFISALLETAWAIGMKMAEGWTKLWPSVFTLVTMVIGFVLLAQAMKSIEVSVAYPVWTGIGALGTIVIGILFLNESADPKKLFFAALILVGVVGMKLVSD